MAVGNYIDPDLMAVNGGELEWEEEDETSLCSPLLLRGGAAVAPQPPPSALSPQTVVEQSLQPDGSIAIKATTTTPHPNGFRDVKIEHFAVPQSDVGSAVDVAPGAPPPGPEYLSRVEYRVLSPGLELAPPDDDASTVYTAPAPAESSVASSCQRKRRRKKRRECRTAIFVAMAFVLLVVIVAAALVRDNSQKNPSDSSHQYPPDSPSNSTSTNGTSVSPEEADEIGKDGNGASAGDFDGTPSSSEHTHTHHTHHTHKHHKHKPQVVPY
ncbi:hypothetical protein ACHAWF_017642 [Thalassiosira exigua]